MLFCSHYNHIVYRLSSWIDAQRHCESENKTLLQRGFENEMTASSKLGDVIFLGLKKNTQV